MITKLRWVAGYVYLWLRIPTATKCARATKNASCLAVKHFSVPDLPTAGLEYSIFDLIFKSYSSENVSLRRIILLLHPPWM